MPPCNSSAAPEATVVPAVVVPNPPPFWMFNAPLLIVVVPVLVLAPESVSVPVPTLFKLPLPPSWPE